MSIAAMPSIEGKGPAGAESMSGRALIRNSLLFGSVSFVAYLFSLGKTILVSRFFGTSAEMDAFTVAILVPNLLGALIMGSAAAGLVPALAKAERQGAQQRADVFRTSFLIVTTICGAGTIALAVLAGPLIHVVASRFDSYRMTLAVDLARWAALLLGLNAMYAFGSAELLARRRYVWVAAAPAVNTLLAIVLIAKFYRLGAAVLVWSLLVGTAVQAAIVLAPAWRASVGGRLSRWRDPYVRRVLASQAPLLAASSIGVANMFVDQFMAAFLPAGNVSALNYATSLNGIAMQMVVMAMGWVVLPDLSAMIAAGQVEGVRQRVRLCVIAAVMLAAPVALAVAGFGEQAIRIVFQHGRFHSDSTTLVFLGWMGYSLGLVPAAIGMIAVRVANGMEENWLLFRIGLALLVTNAVLDYILMRFAGVLGITLSTTLVYCLSCVLVYSALHKRIGTLLPEATLRRILLAVGATMVAALPAAGLRWLAGAGVTVSLAGLTTFAVALVVTYRVAGLIRFDRPSPRDWRAWRYVQLTVGESQ